MYAVGSFAECVFFNMGEVLKSLLIILLWNALLCMSKSWLFSVHMITSVYNSSWYILLGS